MRDINTPWFDAAIISTMFALGHIFFGHFEERTSRKRKVMKYIVTMIVVLVLTHFFGHIVLWILLGVTVIMIGYVHRYLLPKKGINGRTGEPKDKYYEFRGWDKDIFKKK